MKKNIINFGIGAVLMLILCMGIYFVALDSDKPVNKTYVISQDLTKLNTVTVTVTDVVTVTETVSQISDNSLLKEEDLKKIDEIMSKVDEDFFYEYNKEEVKDMMLKGLVAGLGDKYAAYYTEEEYKQFLTDETGYYVGIGVSVSQDASTKQITLVRPFEGSPALEAGLLPGDILLKVEAEDIQTADINYVVSLIRGTEGTPVSITIFRPSTGEELVFTMNRKSLLAETVTHKMLDKKVGYISVDSFDTNTATEFEKALTALYNEGNESLVIDLRDNPGGNLDVVVKMIDDMVPEGTIVKIKDKAGQEYTFSSKAGEYDKPIVILTNEYSASASELFTMALRDYSKALVVGEKTYGKGIVQSFVELSNGTCLKLTTAEYYGPKGYSIHETGIEPDYVVELPKEALTMVNVPLELDTQLQKAIELLTK